MAIADVYKALADPTRRDILKLLQDDDLPAGSIASHFDTTWQTISRHLNTLAQAGLVTSQRQGQQIIYSLTTGVLTDIVTELAEIAGLGQPRPTQANKQAQKARTT